MLSKTQKLTVLLWCFSLLLELAKGVTTDCKAKRKSAAISSVSCCQLTRPELDPGNKDCLGELKLPQHSTPSDNIAINACVEECNFIANGYIDSEPPFVLDLDHIQENVLKIVPEPHEVAAEFLLTAYKNCEKFLKVHPLRLDIKIPDVDFIENACAPFALQISACVRMYAMQECPGEFQVPLETCQEAREFFKSCVARIKSNI